MKVISLIGPKSAQAGVEATFGRTFDGDKGRTATVADGQEPALTALQNDVSERQIQT
jgi:hypothetical protein